MNKIHKPEEQWYIFKGKKFLCDSYTIMRLNLALAMNRENHRYIKL
jgi:hypothetical protein